MNLKLFGLVIGISGIFLIAYAIMSSTEPSEKFKVVDRYKNCNVIRYTDSSNRYHYFLRCSL